MLACRSDFVLTHLFRHFFFLMKMSSVFKLTSAVFGQASTFETRFSFIKANNMNQD